MKTAAELTPYQKMRTSLVDWVDLAEPQWHLLASKFQVKTAQKQEYILLPGAKVHELYFVCSGLLRFYYITDDGTESNKAFITENTFAGSFAAYNLNLPILYGVQALEPTVLLVASFSDFVALFEQHPIFDRLGRKLAEWLLNRKELRTRSLLQQQARERYLDFVKQYPNLVKRVPQYHIASYLGITEVSLSRIKRTVA
ncbi:MAG: Crp/Fnr family transcriptional regulator [Goleter apudmare HA4340-LM2]|jgi:CRP-like cAMP-binding protein|nr:Crp/Fnr family transcriptional regulator [Goleter apudmare HA4340-LM2]